MQTYQISIFPKQKHMFAFSMVKTYHQIIRNAIRSVQNANCATLVKTHLPILPAPARPALPPVAHGALVVHGSTSVVDVVTWA